MDPQITSRHAALRKDTAKAATIFLRIILTFHFLFEDQNFERT